VVFDHKVGRQTDAPLGRILGLRQAPIGAATAHCGPDDRDDGARVHDAASRTFDPELAVEPSGPERRPHRRASGEPTKLQMRSVRAIGHGHLSPPTGYISGIRTVSPGLTFIALLFVGDWARVAAARIRGLLTRRHWVRTREAMDGIVGVLLDDGVGEVGDDL